MSLQAICAMIVAALVAAVAYFKRRSDKATKRADDADARAGSAEQSAVREREARTAGDIIREKAAAEQAKIAKQLGAAEATASAREAVSATETQALNAAGDDAEALAEIGRQRILAERQKAGRP